MATAVAVALGSVVVGPIARAAAQPSVVERGETHWSVRAGIEPTTGGQMHLGGTGSIGGVPVEIEPKRWTRSQKQGGLYVGADVSFGVAAGTECVVSLGYLRLTSKDATIGTALGQPVTARFDNYTAWEATGGVRWFLPNMIHRTYLFGLGGIRRVGAMEADLELDGGREVEVGVPFYDDSFAPTFGGGVGLLFGAAGFEIGFRYTGGLADDDEVLGRLGLAGINDSGERWSVPMSFVYRF
jgi:hypothetical protein